MYVLYFLWDPSVVLPECVSVVGVSGLLMMPECECEVVEGS